MKINWDIKNQPTKRGTMNTIKKLLGLLFSSYPAPPCQSNHYKKH